ncbi:MAG TPA: hypothetical protein V6C57_18035 [Coleofasciculaceae cyanobacterium]
MALAIALSSPNKVVQAAAVAAGSCLVSFTTTTIAIEQTRVRKSRAAHADLYLDLLRQMSRQPSPARPQRPPVCQGCCFYHGQTYSGSRLICAIHPSGVEGDYCLDWQGEGEGGNGK